MVGLCSVCVSCEGKEYDAADHEFVDEAGLLVRGVDVLERCVDRPRQLVRPLARHPLRRRRLGVDERVLLKVRARSLNLYFNI